jgi:hypothetical protein
LLLCGSAAYALCVILAALGISVKSASKLFDIQPFQGCGT